MRNKKRKKHLFIDCGGNDGCSVVKFLLKRPGFDCVTFEPNRIFRKYYWFLPSKLYEKAVYSEDCHAPFYIDPVDGDGSTLLKEKKIDYYGKVKNEQCPKHIVSCINISRFILETTHPDDYVVLKLDVEGAEYAIFEKMIQDGTMERVAELYCEFHWNKIGMPKSEHDQIVQQLQRLVLLQEWDAQDYGVAWRGFDALLMRSKHVAKLWAKRITFATLGR